MVRGYLLRLSLLSIWRGLVRAYTIIPIKITAASAIRIKAVRLLAVVFAAVSVAMYLYALVAGAVLFIGEAVGLFL